MKTPYQRILRAFRNGTGLRLSAEEITALAQDDAIVTVAEEDDQRELHPEIYAAWDTYELATNKVDRAAAYQELVRLGEIPPETTTTTHIFVGGRHA